MVKCSKQLVAQWSYAEPTRNFADSRVEGVAVSCHLGVSVKNITFNNIDPSASFREDRCCNTESAEVKPNVRNNENCPTATVCASHSVDQTSLDLWFNLITRGKPQSEFQLMLY